MSLIKEMLVLAAPSAKKTAKQRDPARKQTKKGNQWFFGLKAHINVDAVTGLTHSVAATSANVADVAMVGHLVRDDDKRVKSACGNTWTMRRPTLWGQCTLNHT